MPARKLLAQVSLAHRSGFGKDRVVNTFAIDDPGGVFDPTAPLPLTSALSDFYNATHAAGASLAFYMSDEISRAVSAHSVKIFDVTSHLDGSPHGSPIAVDYISTTTAAVGAASMPSEVACVMTLRSANYLSYRIEQPDADAPPDGKVDRPRQRASGRIFLGPWAQGAGAEDGNGANRVSSTLQTLILDSAETLFDGLLTAGFIWSVWSRKDQQFKAMETVQVDDAWDTQRSRGVAATGRASRIVNP